jgi:hypothetical protein
MMMQIRQGQGWELLASVIFSLCSTSSAYFASWGWSRRGLRSHEGMIPRSGGGGRNVDPG